MRAREDFGCAEKVVCCCRIKACLPSPPAVVSIFTDSAACVLSFYAPPPRHYIHRDGKCYQWFNRKLTHNVDINKGSSITMWKIHTHTRMHSRTHTHTHCTDWQGWRTVLLNWTILYVWASACMHACTYVCLPTYACRGERFVGWWFDFCSQLWWWG